MQAENEAADGEGAQDSAVQDSRQSDDFYGEYILMQSAVLDQNEAAESPDDGEHNGEEEEAAAPLESSKIRVFLGTQPLITANSLVKTFQREYSIYWAPTKMPIIIEDEDTPGQFQISFNSHFNEEMTITFEFFQYLSENEDFDETQPESHDNPRQIYGFDWLNIEQFRENFANLILCSEEDIRLTYFIVTGFYARCDVHAVNYEFAQGNTINMDLEALKYWRTVPPHIDESKIEEVALYDRDAKEFISNIEERYATLLQAINKLILKNNIDISNRIFRNRLFQASLGKTHDGIMQIIENANEIIQKEAEEASTKLEEHQ